MSTDIRKKGCPNAACRLHTKQVKQNADFNFCPSCGTRTVFVCKKCFCELPDTEERRSLCEECEAELEQKRQDRNDNVKSAAHKGAGLISSATKTVKIFAKELFGPDELEQIRNGHEFNEKQIDRKLRR